MNTRRHIRSGTLRKNGRCTRYGVILNSLIQWSNHGQLKLNSICTFRIHIYSNLQTPVDGSLGWPPMVTCGLLKHRYITSNSHITQFLSHFVIELIKLNLRKLERERKRWTECAEVKEMRCTMVGKGNESNTESITLKQRDENDEKKCESNATHNVRSHSKAHYIESMEDFMCCVDLLIQRFEKKSSLLFASAQHEFHE